MNNPVRSADAGQATVGLTRPLLSRVLFTLVPLVAVVACIRIGGTQERRLVELNAGSMERRSQLAREYVSDRQLASLRQMAKQQFPSLSEQDLASLGLTWQQMAMADGDHVMVVVTFMPESKGVDGKAVADFVARKVLEDLRPKLRGAQHDADPAMLVLRRRTTRCS